MAACRFGIVLRAIALIAILVAVASACNFNPAPAPHLTPTSSVPFAFTATAQAPAEPAISPAVSYPDADRLVSELAGYGVFVADGPQALSGDLQVILDSVIVLAEQISVPLAEASTSARESQEAFRLVFGPTLIRVYPDRETVDGVHYAINCGWEGRFADGCRHIGIYPEQDFPTGKWLILIATRRLHGDLESEGRGLMIHELIHNLTWGDGHNPANVGGFSYVRYVGDDFALTYLDVFGVQAGSDAYLDSAAREANPLWRAELTADAVASWALDAISGPYADSIADYIYNMLVCELRRDPNC